MALKLFVDRTAAHPLDGLVVSFFEPVAATNPGFIRESDIDVEVHSVRLLPAEGRSSARPYAYQDDSALDLSVGVGILELKPTGGNFTVTDPVASQTTGNIPWNAPAADVQTILRTDLSTGYNDCLVTGDAGGPWTITRGTTGAHANLTVTATGLQPANSTAILSNTDGTARLPEQFTLELARALPIGRNSGWSALPAAAVDISTHQAGDATHNKVFKLSWNADAYGGDVQLRFLGSATTATLPSLPYNATAEQVAAAFATHAEVASAAGIAVVRTEPGVYFVTCTAAAIALSDTPALTCTAFSLQVPIGRKGTLNANTAGVTALLAGDTSAEVLLEVRFGNIIAAQLVTTVGANLIRNVQGVATALDPTLTASQIFDAFIAPDAAARAAATPKYLGQPLLQQDTLEWYVAASTSVGDWSTYFRFVDPVAYNYFFKGTTSGLSQLLPTDAFTGAIYLPARAGVLALDADSFSVTKSSNQSVAATTLTAITWQTKKWDTGNWFASSKFTPQRAGKYRFNVGINLSGGAPAEYIVYLYKNGALEKVIAMAHRSYINPTIGSCLATANGTTDNFEIRLYYYGTGPTDVAADDANTYFQGEYVGP